MYLRSLPFLLFSVVVCSQQIGEFTSIAPGAQTTDFIIPATHRFQKIIEAGDPLTEGGVLLNNNDFTGYVPIGGGSENGYLSINAEVNPGGVSILDINYNTNSRLWQVTKSQSVDFSGLGGTVYNCSGVVTPWNTIITCEEHNSADMLASTNPIFDFVESLDMNNDGYDDFGWAIEIDAVTKTVIDQPGGVNGPDKLWALGNFKHENAVIHDNERTLYQGADAAIGYLYKFVANSARNLSSGNIYVYKGSKSGSGNWIQLNNTTQDEQNSTVVQSANVGATVFNGIEDVEIGPNGMIYFAVKGEDRVYRFQDSDPISGTTVTQMETYVGNATYTITHENGTSNADWGGGNDNMAFDLQGNLWVMQDAGNFQNYIWVVEAGHTQNSPKVKIFARTPTNSEPTGITFSPDNRFLFMSLQHPTGANISSTQLDAAGNAIGFDKSISLVISLESTPDLIWYLDEDSDGFAAANTISSPTSPGSGYTTNVLPTTDCDDNDAAINPNTIWYLDADIDGFAHPTTVINCLSPGSGYSISVLPTTDCDDSDATVNATSTWYLDADGDGYADLNTIDSCQSPGAAYSNTVLPATDCDDSDASVNATSTWYLDSDGDGYADLNTIDSCQSPGAGYTNAVFPTTDCNDSNASVNATSIWYLDADGDGYADPTTIDSCQSPGAGYSNTVLPATDCNDSDASVNVSSTWYLDSDGDGYADPTTLESCQSPGAAYTTEILSNTDCDDSNAFVTIETLWYLDENQDGFADELPITACVRPDNNYTQEILPLISTLTADGPILYPNPTKSEVTVLLEKTYEELFVEVYTQNRQRVLKKVISKTNQIIFELTSQQTGIYFLQITSKGKRVGFYKVIRL